MIIQRLKRAFFGNLHACILQRTWSWLVTPLHHMHVPAWHGLCTSISGYPGRVLCTQYRSTGHSTVVPAIVPAIVSRILFLVLGWDGVGRLLRCSTSGIRCRIGQSSLSTLSVLSVRSLSHFPKLLLFCPANAGCPAHTSGLQCFRGRTRFLTPQEISPDQPSCIQCHSTSSLQQFLA